MNLLDAIQNCGDNWFRPAYDSGNGQAYGISGGSIFYHYRGDFCEYAHMPSVEQILTGEWEIVTPEQVIAERK